MLLYRNTIATLVNTWNTNATFSHGFFVPPLAGLLVWHYRGRLRRVEPSTSYLGLLLVAAATLVWLAGDLGYVRVVQQFAMIAVLEAVVVTLLGWAVARSIVLPFLFLFLAVPFGVSIVGPLQDFTAAFLVAALRAVGIPVLQESRIITVPGGSWEVAEACSGMRYLISSAVLGMYVATVAFRKRSKRILVMLAFVLVPIAANAVRAFGIVLIGYWSDNRLARGVDHIIYGWIFFSVVTFSIIGLVMRWRDMGSDEDADVRFTARFNRLARHSSPANFAFTAVACLAIAGIGPVVQARMGRVPEPNLAHVAPVASAPWTQTYGSTPGWVPLTYGEVGTMAQRYSNGVRTVDLSLTFYSTARGGVQLTEAWNQVSDHRRWNRGIARSVTVLVDNQPLSVQQFVIQSAETRRLVWTWYWIGDQYTAKGREVKYVQAKTRLLGRNPIGSVIVVGADFISEQSEAQAALQDFLEHINLQLALRANTGQGQR